MIVVFSLGCFGWVDFGCLFVVCCVVWVGCVDWLGFVVLGLLRCVVVGLCYVWMVCLHGCALLF